MSCWNLDPWISVFSTAQPTWDMESCIIQGSDNVRHAVVVAKYCDVHVCVCVCVSVCVSLCRRACLRNHTRDLYQFFCACCLWSWLGLPPVGWRNPKGKGQFWGFSSQLPMHCNAFAAEGIIQYARQAQIGIRKILSACRRCGLWVEKGVTGVHSAREVWYLRLRCWHSQG